MTPFLTSSYRKADARPLTYCPLGAVWRQYRPLSLRPQPSYRCGHAGHLASLLRCFTTSRAFRASPHHAVTCLLPYTALPLRAPALPTPSYLLRTTLPSCPSALPRHRLSLHSALLAHGLLPCRSVPSPPTWCCVMMAVMVTGGISG